MFQRSLFALPIAVILAASQVHATENEDVQSEAEAYAVASYAALYNLDGGRLVGQLDRNIMWFGTPSAYMGYREALDGAGLMGRLATPQDRIVTEITDIGTAPYGEHEFLVRLGVRQTIEAGGNSQTTCFDAVVTIEENMQPDLRSSPFMHSAQPTRLGDIDCEG